MSLPVFSQSTLGVFTDTADVGVVDHPGAATYDPAAKTYTLTGSGVNMWATSDSFRFLWRKLAGDVSITADVTFATTAGEPHKKAGVILRAGTAADDPYVDVMSHNEGLLAIQYRAEKGGATFDVRTPIKAPATLRLERAGNVFLAEVASKDGIFHPVASLSVQLPETVYAGLAVCAHNPANIEIATFSNVVLRNDGVAAEKDRVLESTLEVVDIASGLRQVVRRAREHFEAPNWSRDGQWMYYNSGGGLYRLAAAGGEPTRIETGKVQLNNDHGLSPDGSQIAISGQIAISAANAGGQSQIWIIPAGGSEPKLVVKAQPSYWHGWSPDGKTLAYCAQRNGNFDVYTIPVEGGEEKRLTTAEGLDDGPDYTPDGQWIYFNSVRTGLMQIWRMHADGSGQEQVSRGPASADWFAHPSPDGQWIAYISYDKSVKEHPPNKDVVLKLAPIAGGDPKVLVTLFGGQGTLNVNSWAPDSKRFAFVSYRLVAPRAAAEPLTAH
jgi:Tol biopolymer transport system component